MKVIEKKIKNKTDNNKKTLAEDILLKKLNTTFTTSCTILILYYAITVLSVFLGINYKNFQQMLIIFFCLASDITPPPQLRQQIIRHPKECNSLAKPRKTHF